jgi:pectinesterase
MRNIMIKRSRLLALVVVGIATLCQGQSGKVIVTVTNSAPVERHAATVSVPWTSLASLLPGFDTKNSKLMVRKNGQSLLCQLFDADLNEAPEELLFQSDFKPMETKVFEVTVAAGVSTMDTTLVDARFVEPRQDIAWENDRIAFRVYGPALAAEVDNGIDVWTKRVRSLIVKKWYEGEEKTPKIVYHEDHGEGADFFNVGRSLGCGGVGVWSNGKLLQPGVFSSYKIISTGPIRASFELTYDKWSINGERLKETVRISLDAGQNLNTIALVFGGAKSGEPLRLAGGLVKRPNTTLYRNTQEGWMSLWGLTNDEVQNGFLGTGIIFSRPDFTTMTEDSAQYLILGKTAVGSTFTYYAGAGWTRSGDFTSEEDWKNYLVSAAVIIRSPLTVNVKLAQ